MLEQAQQLEVTGKQLSAGIETEITLSIDHFCDPRWVYPSIKTFYQESPTTSIQLVETTLSTTQTSVLLKKWMWPLLISLLLIIPLIFLETHK